MASVQFMPRVSSLHVFAKWDPTGQVAPAWASPPLLPFRSTRRTQLALATGVFSSGIFLFFEKKKTSSSSDFCLSPSIAIARSMFLPRRETDVRMQHWRPDDGLRLCCRWHRQWRDEQRARKNWQARAGSEQRGLRDTLEIRRLHLHW